MHACTEYLKYSRDVAEALKTFMKVYLGIKVLVVFWLTWWTYIILQEVKHSGPQKNTAACWVFLGLLLKGEERRSTHLLTLVFWLAMFINVQNDSLVSFSGPVDVWTVDSKECATSSELLWHWLSEWNSFPSSETNPWPSQKQTLLGQYFKAEITGYLYFLRSTIFDVSKAYKHVADVSTRKCGCHMHFWLYDCLMALCDKAKKKKHYDVFICYLYQ